MKQLALKLAPPPAPCLDNFFPGRNAEVIHALQSLAAGVSAERFVYLWGARGCGRSHLLHAMTTALNSRGIAALCVSANEPLPAPDSAIEAIAVDDVERLDSRAQVAFFNLFNSLRERQGVVLSAGNAPPARLQLRPDLLTRLGWGLVYQVHALSDEDKRIALRRHAAARAFDLPDGVADYLLRHRHRDLPSLMAILDALDRYSLETKRPITLPLLRQLLQSDDLGDRLPPA